MKQLDHNETPTARPPRRITLICDGISLPANIGGIFRLADAFGLENIIFGGSKIDTSNRKIKQVSRSTHQWVRHQTSQNLTENIQQLKSQGYRVIALEITNRSMPITSIDIPKETPTAIVIGSEIAGIDESILNLCDQAFHIPIFGKNSSMNVTNALSIILYEVNRRFITNL